MAKPTARIKVGLDTKQAIGEARALGLALAKQFGIGADKARHLADRISLIGTSAGIVGGAIVAVGTAIGAMAVDAVRAFAPLQKAVAEIGTISNQTTFDANKTTKALIDMSRAFGTEATEQAKALYQTISAGVTDEKEAMELLKVANKAAIGGLTETATAVDGLTNIMNAYSMAQSEATKVSDLMFTTVKLGKTTMGELATNVGTVASSAKQAGVEIEEMLAAIGTITTKGLTTSVATTQTKAILAAVAGATETAKQEAKRLGIEFSISALKAKGFTEFLRELSEATNNQQDSLTRLLGTQEAVSGVLNLAGDGFKKYQEALDANRESAGATEEAYKRVSNTIEHQSKIIMSNIAASKLLLGQQLSVGPSMEAISRIASGLADSLGKGATEGSRAAQAIVYLDNAFAGLLNFLDRGTFKDYLEIQFGLLIRLADAADRAAGATRRYKLAADDPEVLARAKARAKEIGERIPGAEIITEDEPFLITAGKAPKTGTTEPLTEEQLKAKERAQKERIKMQDEFRKAEIDAGQWWREEQKRVDREEEKERFEATKARNKNQLAQLEEHFKRMNDMRESQAQIEKDRIEEATNTERAAKEAVAGIMANAFAGVANDLASGNATFESFFGGLIGSVGDALVGLGSAAVAAGILGTTMPAIFGAITAGPAGVAAGVGAIAVGTALKAGSIAAAKSAAGAGGSGVGPSSSISRSEPRSPIRPVDIGGGFAASTSSTMVINLNGPIGGSARSVASDLQRMLGKNAKLNMGGA